MYLDHLGLLLNIEILISLDNFIVEHVLTISTIGLPLTPSPHPPTHTRTNQVSISFETI